jgi:hypothetical protein
LARKALEQKNFGYCAECLRLAKVLADGSQKAQVASLTEEMNKAAEEAIAVADKDYEAGKYEAALKVYEKLAAGLAAHRAGAAAKAKLAAAEKDPSVQAAVQEVRAAAAFEAALAVVQAKDRSSALRNSAKEGATVKDAPSQGLTELTEAISAGAAEPAKRTVQEQDVLALSLPDQAKVLNVLQAVSKSYPSSKTGGQCRELLDKLQANESFKANMDKWKAQESIRLRFQIAQNYEHSQLYRQALAAYQEILSKYPDSDFAAKSKDAIARLSGKKP